MTDKEIYKLASEYYQATKIPHHTVMGFGSIAQILDVKLVYKIMKWTLARTKPESVQKDGAK